MQNTWQLERVAEKSEHWELLEMRPDQYQDRVSHMTVEHLLIKNNTINEFIFNALNDRRDSLDLGLMVFQLDLRWALFLLSILLLMTAGCSIFWRLSLAWRSDGIFSCDIRNSGFLQSFSRRVVSPRCRWGHVGCCLVDNQQLHVYNAPSIRTITLSKHTSAAWIVSVRKWCFAPTLQMIRDKQFYCFIVICPLNGLLPL